MTENFDQFFNHIIRNIKEETPSLSEEGYSVNDMEVERIALSVAPREHISVDRMKGLTAAIKVSKKYAFSVMSAIKDREFSVIFNDSGDDYVHVLVMSKSPTIRNEFFKNNAKYLHGFVHF